MKRMLSVGLALLIAVGTLAAAERSGLQPGQSIGAFEVVKVGGAPNDDVSVGKELCYRCKYGNRPMVMVFTRGSDEKLVSLVKQIDAAVAKNSASQLRAFVNVMADNKAAAEATAKGFASQNLANVPVVIPVDYQNGPGNYSLNPQAQLTIIIANDGKVEVNHVFESGLSCESCIESVMTDVNKLAAK
ncbi:MAG: hypothetical protein JSS27_01770 [Planctomycetes bacterium]|nr:hypothetical protein [Planctomycetota bacterium]